MKIYTKVVMDIESLCIIEEDSYEYSGAVSECKGGVETKMVQSPEAQQALTSVMPALQRIGQQGGEGLPLYNIPAPPIGQGMGFFNNAMPSAQNIGSIDPNIQRAVAEPFEMAMGQITEKFGGGMGSARGGLSGAGGQVLMDASKQMIPQYTKQLWDMVQPGEMAKAQYGAGMTQQAWGADIAARQAPFGPITQIAGGTMPTTIGGMSKK